MSNALAVEVGNVDVDGEGGSKQYVTFQVADEVFGFPMVSVLEIIRVPDTVQVPLTPGALVGLANLRGSVLPVLDLRRMLQLDMSDYNDASRVVVVDAGNPVGLVVDRVARVMEVAPECIEVADDVQSTADADLLAGVIKAGNDESLVQLLNIDKLIEQEFSLVAASASTDGMELGGGNTRTEPECDETDEETDQLVSFTAEGQEFAFRLMEVEEIVRLPDSIAQVPAVDDHVLGLIDLRGRLLPLVSFRRMFELEDKTLNEENRILVISLRRPGGRKDSVGLVVDEVNEVLHVPRDVQESVPALLGENDDEILKVCCLDSGRRLVSLLGAESLFAHPAVRSALESRGKEEERNMVNDEHIQDLETEDDTEQLVVFRLAEQEYGVSIDDVQEITRLPEQLDKVPKTPEFIEGMINLRGMVLPVLDMRVRFGMDKMEPNDRQRIIVLGLDGTRTGFIVDSVAEVLSLPCERIEPAPNLSEDQARIMGRVANLKEKKRMIQVVTARELLNDQEKEAVRNDG